jgi:hypothetical protein
MSLELFLDLDLHMISNQMVRRRVKRELLDLVHFNICSLTGITIQPTDGKYMISILNKMDNRVYTMVITDKYPFAMPKYEINHRRYQLPHGILSEPFKQKIYTLFGIKCFCCESITCEHRWNAIYTFKHFIKEATYYNMCVRTVVLHLIVDVIKRKYLNNDINIIQWL